MGGGFRIGGLRIGARRSAAEGERRPDRVSHCESKSKKKKNSFHPIPPKISAVDRADAGWLWWNRPWGGGWGGGWNNGASSARWAARGEKESR